MTSGGSHFGPLVAYIFFGQLYVSLSDSLCIFKYICFFFTIWNINKLHEGKDFVLINVLFIALRIELGTSHITYFLNISGVYNLKTKYILSNSERVLRSCIWNFVGTPVFACAFFLYPTITFPLLKP